MADYIYASTPATGTDRVRLPGDPEKETQAQRVANGAEIDPNSWQSVLNAAEQAGLNRETVAAMADISEA
jgi:uncharacterized oxidoreductase